MPALTSITLGKYAFYAATFMEFQGRNVILISS